MKKIFFLICLGVLSNMAFAQQFELKYHHTALLVSDLDKSADFYGNILQLKEIEVPYSNPVLRWFSLGEDLQLHLVKDNNEGVKLHKAIHIALNVSHFDAFVDYLKENKIPYSDWLGEAEKVAIRGDGVKQVYIQDPDGHWIEINDAE
ncbi:VOC family protein [Gillisia sp. Q332]|uniref:VOC family protein n=1 Tax=Gillisia xinjiangensis TaxID=3384765 RepID=UPI00391C6291